MESAHKLQFGARGTVLSQLRALLPLNNMHAPLSADLKRLKSFGPCLVGTSRVGQPEVISLLTDSDDDECDPQPCKPPSAAAAAAAPDPNAKSSTQKALVVVKEKGWVAVKAEPTHRDSPHKYGGSSSRSSQFVDLPEIGDSSSTPFGTMRNRACLAVNIVLDRLTVDGPSRFAVDEVVFYWSVDQWCKFVDLYPALSRAYKAGDEEAMRGVMKLHLGGVDIHKKK